MVTPTESIKWKRRPLSTMGQTYKALNFEESVLCSPTQYFKRYIPDDLFTSIAAYTIIYALQQGKSSFNLPMYWDTSLKVNVFWENISRDRFLELRTNLHLVNNLEKPPENKDKFYKFRPVYTAIRKRCSDLPIEENVCVDEGIIPFTAKFTAKQCVRGNQVHGESMSSCCVESVLLFQVLKSQGINAVGTVRQNRFGKNLPFSDDKTIMKQTRGYCEEITSADEITMCKWLDNRPIVLCSNFVGKGSVDEVELWNKKHHKYVKVERSEIVRKYNHAMGGVDLFDQLISSYIVFIRSRKWSCV
ncbi:piggyBac transposable element-derived protein 1-like [Schistocerca cancellata]|uniref:piggyBac transposable element-derived protein 1-like n=1 Tax=Schistocerca cancellata TaxID=274614 RepID=UPI002118E157|nr:piggyBac transposable element-derived protein 1-like [Schistocerca cancellata]